MTKIISLFEKKKEIEEEKKQIESEDSESFEEIMKANELKKEKAAKERLAANKSVLRTYRIKH